MLIVFLVFPRHNKQVQNYFQTVTKVPHRHECGECTISHK